MDEQPAGQAKDVFPVFVFAIALFGGGILGYMLTSELSPEAGIARFVGAFLPPLGVILGLSIAEGVDGPLALLRIFSVLDGRHTFAEVLALGGKPRASILVFPAMMMAGTTAACVAGALPIHIFTKPDLDIVTFASYFGIGGLAYGVAMALLLRFLTAEED